MRIRRTGCTMIEYRADIAVRRKCCVTSSSVGYRYQPCDIFVLSIIIVISLFSAYILL